MKKIIIFRFHDHPRICQNRLRFLKRLNDLPIYGLFGGGDQDIHKRYCAHYLEHFYTIRGKRPEWKWKHFDLALRDWYKKAGHSVDFDVAYVIEWDLLLLDSIDRVFPRITRNGVGLTGLTDLSNVEDKWSWVAKEPYRREWLKLKSLVKRRYGYEGPYYASLGPGLSVSKNFLDAYSSEKVPEYCNDEVRVPLFASALGFRLIDTGFYRRWRSPKIHRHFNCKNIPISLETIREEQKKSNGRRAFHPYRKLFHDF